MPYAFLWLLKLRYAPKKEDVMLPGARGLTLMDDPSTKFLRQEYEQLYRLCMLQSRLLQKVGQPASETETVERLIRLPDVLRRCGMSKRTVYRLESAGRFPARRHLGERAIGWAESEVRAWIADPRGWRARDTA